jgi:hypothetical protein
MERGGKVGGADELVQLRVRSSINTGIDTRLSFQLCASSLDTVSIFVQLFHNESQKFLSEKITELLGLEEHI